MAKAAIKSPANRLTAARDGLAEVEQAIVKLEAARTDALLGDRDDEAVKLDLELEQGRGKQRAFRDKVQLLEIEVKKAEGERLAREREGLIKRLEAKLAQRDAAGAELTAGLVQADQALRKMIDIGHELLGAWAWVRNDQDVAALLQPWRVLEVLRHELYRIGGRPVITGGMPGVAAPSFPGGLPPSNALLGMPERIPALPDVLKDASAYAVRVMRSGRGLADPPAPVEAQPAAPPVTNGNAKEAPSEATRPVLPPSTGRTTVAAGRAERTVGPGCDRPLAGG